MAVRTIPEDDQPVSTVKQPGNGPGFNSPSKINQIKNQYRRQSLINRVKSKAPGYMTPHQQHVAHEQHMANVENNQAKYGKQRNY